MLIDSHCHIHDLQFFPENREEVYRRAIEGNVEMVLVGTSVTDSKEAVEFAKTHDGTWAVVGVHPHETKEGWAGVGEILANYLPKQADMRQDSVLSDSLCSAELATLKQSSSGHESLSTSSGHTDNVSGKKLAKIIGVGEVGLDYFYDHSPRDIQIRALEEQLQWALDDNLPVSFHVREAYDDFWPIFDNFPGVKGVLHCFTDTAKALEKALSRGLYVGVNGISTFTKDEAQKAMFTSIPLERMLLETDAPFLTPVPFRGKVNEPVFVTEVAKQQAKVKNLPLEEIIAVTSANTRALFRV